MTHEDPSATHYAIGELATLGGVSRRTVRYYVTRGLLSPPEGTGRGAYYTHEHLERLIRIRELQEANVPLADIPGHLDRPPASMARPPDRADGRRVGEAGSRAGPGALPVDASSGAPPTRWRRAPIRDGIELHVRDGAISDAALDVLVSLLVRHSAPPPTLEDPNAP